MTRGGWKEYLKKYKNYDTISIGTAKDIIDDWARNIETINMKLNQLQDEIYRLNKEIN